MYSPFYQLKKPADQQNAMKTAQEFPAHLVPGNLPYIPATTKCLVF